MRSLGALCLALCACGSSAATPDAAVDRPVALDTSPALDTPPVVDVPPASDGPLLAPRDGGDPFTDAGALGEPPWAAIEVRTGGACAPLNVCGGDELGTWDVSGGCIEVPIESQLASCPGARVTRAAGRGRGRVTFASGFARRTAQWEAEVEVFVPALCAGFVGGCAGIASTLRGFAMESACATEGAGDCRCAARQTGGFNDADGYAVMGQQIVSATLNKRWNYCVSDAQLRYQDASPSGAREPGIIALTRR